MLWGVLTRLSQISCPLWCWKSAGMTDMHHLVYSVNLPGYAVPPSDMNAIWHINSQHSIHSISIQPGFVSILTSTPDKERQTSIWSGEMCPTMYSWELSASCRIQNSLWVEAPFWGQAQLIGTYLKSSLQGLTYWRNPIFQIRWRCPVFDFS